MATCKILCHLEEDAGYKCTVDCPKIATVSTNPENDEIAEKSLHRKDKRIWIILLIVLIILIFLGIKLTHRS